MENTAEKLYEEIINLNELSYIDIEKAKEILETGEYRVCEVGEMVGIEDPAYFTHVFLKYEGKSPSDFMNR